MQWRIISSVILLVAFCLGTPFVASAQNSDLPAGCVQILGRLPRDVATFGHRLLMAPRNAIRPRNLAWELPVAGVTAALIATGADTHVDNHIRSASLVRNSGRASNIGLGTELGVAGLMYASGCASHRSYMANTGWTALEAMGGASVLNYGVKALTNRQYANSGNSTGEFWDGGKSFPSGHAAASFAFASVVAHRYPNNFWLKVGVYGLATGVSLSRVTGKKHFPSDVLVGATLGYITGTYLSRHTETAP